MKKISKDLKYLFIIWITLILSVFFTYAHHGGLIIDCGREAYYPTQILSGSVLYKDIFNIYGPFSYLFNAFLFKIFGINLNVLYFAGIFSAFLISTMFYKISRHFLGGFISLSIAIFVVMTGVLSTYLSNFIFPYSYAMLYGLASFLLSFFFLLKYHSENQAQNLYLCTFFAGLCLANKYEFFPYLLAIFYVMLRVKPKFKEYLLSFFSLLIVPTICLGVLFLQGLRVNDIFNIFSILQKMTQTQTFYYFYRLQGVYFNELLFMYGLKAFAFTLFSAFCFMYGFKSQNKLNKLLLMILSVYLVISIANPLSFALLPMFMLILILLDLKNLKQDFPLQVLVLSAILFSLKSILVLNLGHYGNFFIGFLFIAVISLLKSKWDEKVNCKAIGVYLILFACVLCYQNLISSHRNYALTTPRGKFYTEISLYSSTNDLIIYIENNTKKNDKIVILPEGAMINFLTNRPSDNFYTSLIPLYVETFGEYKIIKHFEQNSPEYFVFNNWNSQDYYFKNICNDYAVSFCNYVAKNYTQEKVIDKGFRYLIFKRK